MSQCSKFSHTWEGRDHGNLVYKWLVRSTSDNLDLLSAFEVGTVWCDWALSLWDLMLCCCSAIHSCLTLSTPWTAAHQASLSFTISWSLLKLISIGSVMPSNRLVLCYPLLFLPSIFPSIRVFSNELFLCSRWPKIGASASASVLPVNIQGGFPLGIDWFDLFTAQGTLKSLL